MNRYTNFILTVIAVVMLGILFKGEMNNPAHAFSNGYIGNQVNTNQGMLRTVLDNLNTINNNILQRCK